MSVDGGIEEARRRLRELPRRPVHPDLRVEDHAIDGPRGAIPVRVYWPAGTPSPPARWWCPAAVDDVWAATRWVADNADRFGADASRLAVAGDSAGGTLSAVVAQLARDNGGPALAFQLLWYPSTMWDTSLPSFTENADAPVLDTAAISAFARWYPGHVDLTTPPSGLAPGRAAVLAGLPPAYIAVAGHDPLRDDGARYAELLSAAGVDVELHDAETLVHGYGYAGVVPAATEAAELGLAALRAA